MKCDLRSLYFKFRYRSYWKGSLRVTLDYGRQLYFYFIWFQVFLNNTNNFKIGLFDP